MHLFRLVGDPKVPHGTEIRRVVFAEHLLSKWSKNSNIHISSAYFPRSRRPEKFHVELKFGGSFSRLSQLVNGLKISTYINSAPLPGFRLVSDPKVPPVAEIQRVWGYRNEAFGITVLSSKGIAFVKLDCNLECLGGPKPYRGEALGITV